MSENQIKSWIDLQSKLKGRRLQVYNIIKEKPATLFEVADALGVPVNYVTGRITELKNLGLIKSAGEKINKISGKMVTVYHTCYLSLF